MAALKSVGITATLSDVRLEAASIIGANSRVKDLTIIVWERGCTHRNDCIKVSWNHIYTFRYKARGYLHYRGHLARQGLLKNMHQNM